MELPKEQDVLLLIYAIDKRDPYIYSYAKDIIADLETPEQLDLKYCLVNTLGGWFDPWVSPNALEEEVIEIIQSCSAGLNYYP